ESKVNVFIIEEPEAHMHPQMQKVFIEYLKEYYKDEGIQGFITTHSSDIVRVNSLPCIRVIRPRESFTSKVYDMATFEDSLKEKGDEAYDLKRFYNIFFNLNLSELIFADRAI